MAVDESQGKLRPISALGRLRWREEGGEEERKKEAGSYFPSVSAFFISLCSGEKREEKGGKKEKCHPVRFLPSFLPFFLLMIKANCSLTLSFFSFLDQEKRRKKNRTEQGRWRKLPVLMALSPPSIGAVSGSDQGEKKKRSSFPSFSSFRLVESFGSLLERPRE